MTLPDFFLIGAMKAGTTSVHRYLSEHPDLFLPDIKEPNFFWLGDLPRAEIPATMQRHSILDSDVYEALFTPARPGQQIGEASIGYLTSSRAANRIAARAPDARFIAILRDPAERAWSHFVFNRERGDEPLEDFEQALAQEEDRRAAGLAGSFYAYRWHGFYASQLRAYDALFPRERIQVLLYEDLVEDPRRFLESIFEFLGVDTSFEPDTTLHYNVSGVARHPAIAWILQRANTIRGPLVRRAPPRVVSRIGSLLRKPPRTLDARLRADLVSGYRDDILRLGDRIERDLGSWLR